MKIKDADGTVFDLPKNVATGLARSASNTFELVVDEPDEADAPAEAEAKPARKTPAPTPPADPDEVPTSAWTNARIGAWAKGRVDLGGATKKEDMLAAIAAASIASTAAALDAALTPAGQEPVITGTELEDEDADEPAPAEDEDDTLEPDDPEPEDDEPASDGEG